MGGRTDWDAVRTDDGVHSSTNMYAPAYVYSRGIHRWGYRIALGRSVIPTYTARRCAKPHELTPLEEIGWAGQGRRQSRLRSSGNFPKVPCKLRLRLGGERTSLEIG